MSKTTAFLIAAFTFALGLAAGIIAISPEMEKLKTEKADAIKEKENIEARLTKTNTKLTDAQNSKWRKMENLKTDLNKANFAKRQLEADVRKLTKQIAVNGADKDITSLSASAKKQVLAKYREDQRGFHLERKRLYQRYNNAANEIAESTVFRDAGEYTSKFFRERSNVIENWQGVIRSIDTPHGGDTASVIIVSDFSGFEIEFKTDRSTLLGRNTKPYDQLMKVHKGSSVIFSAEVISVDSEKGIKEKSWTEKGSLRAPEFIVEFTDFQAYE